MMYIIINDVHHIAIILYRMNYISVFVTLIANPKIKIPKNILFQTFDHSSPPNQVPPTIPTTSPLTEEISQTEQAQVQEIIIPNSLKQPTTSMNKLLRPVLSSH